MREDDGMRNDRQDSTGEELRPAPQCSHWFEDFDDWGDSYYEKHTHKGRKFFMPKNAQRAVARYIKKHKIKVT